MKWGAEECLLFKWAALWEIRMSSVIELKENRRVSIRMFNKSV